MAKKKLTKKSSAKKKPTKKKPTKKKPTKKKSTKKKSTKKKSTKKKSTKKKSTKKVSSIHDLPWSKIESCYGNSTEIPDRISKLGKKISQQEANEICFFLENELEHQCSIYRATVFATPFLIDFLSAPNKATTPDILRLLLRLYSAASQITRECDLELDGKDAVKTPERYRKPSVLKLEPTEEEGIAGVILIISDVEASQQQLKKLAASKTKEISEAANVLLNKIDSEEALKNQSQDDSPGDAGCDHYSELLRLDGKDLLYIVHMDVENFEETVLLDSAALTATFSNRKNADKFAAENGLKFSYKNQTLVDFDSALQWKNKRDSTPAMNKNAQHAFNCLATVFTSFPKKASSLEALLDWDLFQDLERASKVKWSASSEQKLRKLFIQGAKVLKKVLGKSNRS